MSAGFFYTMSYIVYILKSEKDGGYYYGYTANLQARLIRHNDGLVRNTKARRPFVIKIKHQELKKSLTLSTI